MVQILCYKLLPQVLAHCRREVETGWIVQKCSLIMLFSSLYSESPILSLNGRVTKSKGYLWGPSLLSALIHSRNCKSLLYDRCSAGFWEYEVEEDTFLKEPPPQRETDNDNKYQCYQRLSLPCIHA